MSFFNSRNFGSQAAFVTNNPAAEVARLLNSYSNQFIAVEKAINDTRSQQAEAQQAYHKAVQELHGAKEQLVRAEGALARIQADGKHVQQDVEAKQGTNGKLKEEVNKLKDEETQLLQLMESARAAFLQECSNLSEQLRALKKAHPDAFFKARPES
ncbi:hypothetical protein N2152v2_010125 [Parachlorella kessleri]